eukprot:1924959-Rhodomonas_salina.4
MWGMRRRIRGLVQGMCRRIRGLRIPDHIDHAPGSRIADVSTGQCLDDTAVQYAQCLARYSSKVRTVPSTTQQYILHQYWNESKW